jgi:hypothetical protein
MRRGINIIPTRHSVTFYIQWLSWFLFIRWCECCVGVSNWPPRMIQVWHQQQNLAWFWICNFVEGCSSFHILVLICEISCTVISYSTYLWQSYRIHTYAHRIWDCVKDTQYLIQKNSHLVMNNDLSLMFFVHVNRPLHGHHQGGTYKGIQLQQILSKMCMCRV